MPEPIRIAISVEGGVVGSVLCTVPAQVTLVDFDDIEAGGAVESWDYDADNAAADIEELIAAGQAAVLEEQGAAKEAELQDKKSQYIASGGLRCPYCGSDQLKAKDTDAADAAVVRQIHCAGCGQRWANVYQLTGLREGE